MASTRSTDLPLSPVLPPSEMETEPPSSSHAPSTTRVSLQAAASVRARAPIRTYGKRQAPEQEVNREEERPKGKSLERESTMVVPETDPDIEMDDSEGPGTLEGGRDASNSSSPPQSEPRSTSPTSTEEDGAHHAGSTKRVSLLENLSGESSDEEGQEHEGEEEEEEEEGGATAWVKKNGTLSQLLRDVDAQIDLSAVQPTGSNIPAPPSSSSLPTLTDSDPPSHRNPSSQPTPTARRASGNLLHDEPDDSESQAVPAPTERSRRAPRIADSEEDEDGEENAEADTTVRARQSSGKSNGNRSSDHEGAVGSSSPARETSTAPTSYPSKQERLRMIAAKKKAALAPVESPPREKREDPSDSIKDSSSDEEQVPTFQKKRPKKAGPSKARAKKLSKKDEEEMHKQTASYAREQPARLAPTTKNLMRVAATLKNTRSNRPSSPAPIPFHTTQRKPEEITLSSSSQATSDPIVTYSSPPAQNGQDLPRSSAKALGKQPESPVAIGADSTPRIQKRRTIAPPSPWLKKTASAKSGSGDDGDDLLDLEEMLARTRQEKEEKAAAEKKKADKRRARQPMNRAARLDSDDLEIEGQPMLCPRPPNAPRRTSAESTSRFVNAAARPGTQLHHVLHDLAHVDTNHHDAPTDSQFHQNGKDYGQNLAPAHHYAPSSASGKSKRAATSKPDQYDLNAMLAEKARRQNIRTRTEKAGRARTEQLNKTESAQNEPEKIDVNEMLEKKKKQREVQQVEEDLLDEAEDSDYKAGSDDEDEGEAQMSEEEEQEAGNDVGSGSDVAAEPKKRSTATRAELEEVEFDSEGEVLLPPSSQNSDRLGHRDAAQSHDEDDDDEEEEPIVDRKRAGKARPIVDDDEDEEEKESSSSKSTVPTLQATEVVPTVEVSPAPARMDLDVFGGGDDGGGFSQFFNSQFSQAVAGDNDGEGFARPADPSPFGNVAPTMFAPEPLISTAERAADAALLEARGGIHNTEPGTPREAAVPRQYINKQGFMTQTRPVGLFADSPSYSPRDSQPFQNSLSSAQDSQSQHFTQTQVDATPTQAVRKANQLRRQQALVAKDSLSETQPDPTEVVDDEESFPSAAQPLTAAPPRDAFSVLGKRAALEPIQERQDVPKRRRGPNAFVDNEAHLDSDEEQAGGLNAASGDEDEEGHDAELADLVDNTVVDQEIEAVQDELARKRHQEDEQMEDEKRLREAQAIAHGKQRQGRKMYLDDYDFDDEYQRPEKGEKQQRIDNLTTTELLQNPATRGFGEALASTSVPQIDTALFESPEEPDHAVDAEDLDDVPESQDFFGGQKVKTRTTYNDLQFEAIQKQKEFDDARYNAEDIESQIEFQMGNSSSPVAQFRTVNRIHTAVSNPTVLQPRTDEYENIESQYSLGVGNSAQSFVKYKTGDSREDSQGSGNGMSAGSKSAITSFGKSGTNTSKSSSSSSSKRGSSAGLSTAASSRTSLSSKSSSRFASMRKGGFAS